MDKSLIGDKGERNIHTTTVSSASAEPASTI